MDLAALMSERGWMPSDSHSAGECCPFPARQQRYLFAMLCC